MENIIAKHVVFTYPNMIKVISDKNDNVSCRPFFEDIVENATITFNNEGNITIEGDFWQFGFFPYDEYLSNIEYQVHPDYIEKTRFLKKDIVRVGWHRKLENKHKSIIVTNYTIIKEE